MSDGLITMCYLATELPSPPAESLNDAAESVPFWGVSDQTVAL